PKNSANSSKPSSQTPKDDTAITHPGANSKGNKHNAICCDNYPLLGGQQEILWYSIQRYYLLILRR
ncbi:hypothetical protein, partial [Thiolapillus sp.]|uniref:hypothetical protein n=1 Tax=Thiolapillus sp. TaxID=2017437 RepID=UPI003AF8F053